MDSRAVKRAPSRITTAEGKPFETAQSSQVARGAHASIKSEFEALF